MFLAIVISLIVGILFGGYGGYTWGRSVEAKAQAVAAALRQSAGSVDAAIKK
jgi:hypothetical protein